MAENEFDNNSGFLPRESAGLTEKDRLLGLISGLKYDLKQLDKEISAEEKSIREEIESKTGTRRDEVLGGYDERLKEIDGRKKKLISEKEKKLSSAKASRIKNETKDHVEDAKDTERELRRLYRENKIPFFARTRLFHILFMPEGIKETILMMFGFLIIFAGIPALITFVALNVWLKDASDGTRTTLGILIPVLLILINLFIVFTINFKVKRKHIDTLRLGRRYRKALRLNDEKIREIRRSIESDPDDRRYGVEDLQSEIDGVLKEENEARAEREKALEVFEKETAVEIRSEAESRRGPALLELKQKREAKQKELDQAEKRLSEVSMVIIEADHVPEQKTDVSPDPSPDSSSEDRTDPEDQSVDSDSE